MTQVANPLVQDLDHVLDHSAAVWEKLRGARLFITGGTGFFGCWLLESLVWANDRLGIDARAVVLTRDPEAFARKAPHLAHHQSLRLLAGDVRSFAPPGGAFSHIIHAATEASATLNAEKPLLMLDTILDGTRRTLDFAVACKAERFLLTSSGAVYGRQPTELTHAPEEYAGGPDTARAASAYGEGKRAAELLCTLYSHSYGLQTVSARCFAFVGPYLPLDGTFAIGNFIRDGLQGKTIEVNGDGTPYRSYLYAADLAIWLWTLLCEGESGRPYNVGSDADLQIADVAQAVRRAFENRIEVVIRKTPTSGQAPERYVPDIRRARAELNLQPWIGLNEAIRRTIAWHKQA